MPPSQRRLWRLWRGEGLHLGCLILTAQQRGSLFHTGPRQPGLRATHPPPQGPPGPQPRLHGSSRGPFHQRPAAGRGHGEASSAETGSKAKRDPFPRKKAGAGGGGRPCPSFHAQTSPPGFLSPKIFISFPHLLNTHPPTHTHTHTACALTPSPTSTSPSA